MPPLSAEFLTSVAEGGTLHTEGLPCLALVGRSNVGKSSLINALARRRIARSGAKPGTTRLLNLYRISVPPPHRRAFILVDLPGYGYARGGERARREFDGLTDSFFRQCRRPAAPAPLEREPSLATLAGVLLVVDARHPGLESDTSALRWLQERGYPIVTVATKADRVSRAALRRLVDEHRRVLQEEVLAVSSRTGHGLSVVWGRVRAMVSDAPGGR